MSERVRMARALDAIEKVVDRCCEMAVEEVVENRHLQYDLTYDIAGAVKDAAEFYSVDADEVAREAWKMLRNGLNNALRPICEIKYIKPHQKDGATAGMTVKAYKFDWIGRSA